MIGGQRSFDELSAPLHAVPFCVLDLETTGATPVDCEITEIGAVKFLGGEEIGRFETLVDPGAPIPPLITVLTGITQAMVVEAPPIEEVLPALLEFIGDAVIVGHNVRFDMAFLNAAAGRLGYGRLRNLTADTARLSRRLLVDEVRNHRLATLATHFRSPIVPNHRAFADAAATAHVFFELLDRAGTIGVTHLDDLMHLPTARGARHYEKIALTDGLPRRPGVYLFRDRSGEVIYVGKATNLRTRVRSYFYGDKRRSVAQMLRNLATIDHRVCPTELEAAVTEIRLIHAHRPRYNRRSRPAKSTHWLRLTDERFPRLSIVRSQTPPALAYLGPFRRRKTAEMAMFALWDSVPIRRCTGSTRNRSACRFSQLGVALCPCDGTVSVDEYRIVVAQVRSGLEAGLETLTTPVAAQLRLLAAAQRYEEAAEVRDRHRALVAAVEVRRRWQTLAGAGVVWAEDDSGDAVIVDGGALVATYRSDRDQPPLLSVGREVAPWPETPPSVAAAEELNLIWKWLDRDGVHLVDATSPLASPVATVRPLRSLAS